MRALRNRVRRLEAGRGPAEHPQPVIVRIVDTTTPEPGEVLTESDYSDAAITALRCKGKSFARQPGEAVEAVIERVRLDDPDALLFFAEYRDTQQGEQPWRAH